MSHKKDYFDYVANVLGVKSVLLNQDSATVKQIIPLLIAVENLSGYSAEEEELLAKMIAALKIDLNLIKVVDLDQSALFQSEFLIRFLDDLAKNSVQAMNIISTYSPKFLLKNPQYKKNAWDEMQKAILYFNSKS